LWPGQVLIRSGKWPRRCWEWLQAEAAISRLNRDLEQQFTAWRERPLQADFRILYLDGIHFSVRHRDQADSTMILTALGVDLAGNKEVLALRACAEEEDKTLTFYDFPQTMHRYIKTTNAIESLWSLVRQRTDQIDVFTTEMSCLTIVWATMQGIRLRKVPVE
jgi:transposase-like protein